jgi:hypothetical protein
VRTEIFEADPFTNARTTHFLTVETDYRFEQREEFFLTTDQGQRFKVRITHLRLEVTPNGIHRELIVMKL